MKPIHILTLTLLLSCKHLYALECPSHTDSKLSKSRTGTIAYTSKKYHQEWCIIPFDERKVGKWIGTEKNISPDYVIESMEYIYDSKNITIPRAFYHDIYNPTNIRSVYDKYYTHHIVIQGGKGPGSVEVWLVIQQDRVTNRVIKKLKGYGPYGEHVYGN